MTDQILGFMLERGVLGVVVLGLAYWLVKQDRERQAERKSAADQLQAERLAAAARESMLLEKILEEKNGRIGDSKEFNGAALKLQEAVFVTIHAAKVADEKIAAEIRANTDVTAQLLATMRGAGNGSDTEKKR